MLLTARFLVLHLLIVGVYWADNDSTTGASLKEVFVRRRVLQRRRALRLLRHSPVSGGVPRDTCLCSNSTTRFGFHIPHFIFGFYIPHFAFRIPHFTFSLVTAEAPTFCSKFPHHFCAFFEFSILVLFLIHQQKNLQQQ
jgi:hypothetical protein